MVQGLGLRGQRSGLRDQVLGVWGNRSGFRVQGSGFRVQGSGFRVQTGLAVQQAACFWREWFWREVDEVCPVQVCIHLVEG